MESINNKENWLVCNNTMCMINDDIREFDHVRIPCVLVTTSPGNLCKWAKLFADEINESCRKHSWIQADKCSFASEIVSAYSDDISVDAHATAYQNRYAAGVSYVGLWSSDTIQPMSSYEHTMYSMCIWEHLWFPVYICYTFMDLIMLRNIREIMTSYDLSK